MEAKNDNKNTRISSTTNLQRLQRHMYLRIKYVNKKEHIERYPNLMQVSSTYKHNTYIWH